MSAHAVTPGAWTILGVLLLGVATGACRETPTRTRQDGAAERAQPRLETLARRGILDITARNFTLQAPAEIPSGWTTIRLHNESTATHFVVLEKLPPGKTVADSKAEILPVFQEGMDLLIAGRVNDALAKFKELPAWFSDVVYTGGPGLTAPGLTSEVTVRLEPGTYVLECYVKNPAGQFHSHLGMIDQVVVQADESGAPEPGSRSPSEVTSEVLIRNDGIQFGGDPRPGRQTIAVHFAEQQVNGNFLGNDVHLVRLEATTDIDELAAWMTWTAPAGLATPAPATFLGGLHEMPAGQTGYIDALLAPGRYAWIAEVDDPVGRHMFLPFTIPTGN